jgi:preprotein translocase subunit SecG
MLTFVTIIHVLLCVFMMFVILLQPGKDAGMGAALGGGAATSAFGGRGAVTFLSKVTAVCAALFFLTSLGLSFVGMKRSIAAGITVPKKAAATPKAAGADRGVATGSAAPVESSEEAAQSEPTAPVESTAPATSPAPTNKAGADQAASDKKATSPRKSAAPTKKGLPVPNKP